MNATVSGSFYHGEMLGNRSKCCHRARSGDVKHPVEIGIEKTPIEPELASVPVRYLAIGFIDTDKCNLALVSALEDPGDVTMGKSRNRDGYALR